MKDKTAGSNRRWKLAAAPAEILQGEPAEAVAVEPAWQDGPCPARSQV